MVSKPLPAGRKQHVFFLYRTEDSSRNFMLQLKNTLQTKGYICGIHEEDFIIGKSYLYNVETCIKSAVVIVPWISKEFLNSSFCMKDLDIACHFYHQGIMVMPLLYNLQLRHIPDILQQLVCLDVSRDLCFWIDRFLESLSSHIRSTLSVISPLQEVNGLVEQFDRMSVQAKIIFASKSNAENMFDISRMMNDIPVSQEELLNIFEIKLIKNLDCFHVVEDNFSSNELVSECEICVLFSFNTDTICDNTVISLLSRVCATQLQSIAPRNNEYTKVCAVLEYILKNSVDISGSDGSILHLCYENNYFMGGPRRKSRMKANNIRVYDNAGKHIRMSCLVLGFA
jgi:hypothetical protein